MTPAVSFPAPVIPDYELLRLVGRGSYGDVWLARGVTGIFRAVKIVWRDRFADPQPFEREFRGLKEFATVSLTESRQLALLHVGRHDEAGFFYYVMELADDATRGREIDPASYTPNSLREVRARRGRLPATEVVALGTELARGLAGLHTRGLVHRDIKPSNVIFVGGQPKLADIGLVASASAALTFVGTEGYVPPEGPGAPAADVFSLGKLLYELATGLDRHDYPRLPPDFHTLADRKELLELNEVLIRACEPIAAKRHRDATALLDDLLLLQAGKSVRARMRWRRARRRVAVLSAILALGVVIQGKWPALKNAAHAFASQRSGLLVAILPLESAATEPNLATLSAGLQDELAATLLRLSDARVLTAASVRASKIGRGDFSEARSKLGADAVLTGSIQKSHDLLRFTFQLVDTRDGTAQWTKRYERRETDLFNLQTDIATDVALQLDAKAHSSPARRHIGTASTNPTAQRLFLTGRALASDASSANTDLLKARDCFAEAAKLDPEFALALAHQSLVDTRLYLWRHDQKSGRLEQGLEAAQQALRINPDLAEAQAALGLYYYRRSRDYTSARGPIDRAFALAPNNPEVRSALAALERRSGAFAGAASHYQAALELDPFNGTLAYNAADTFLRLRRYPEAEAIVTRSLERLPGNVPLIKLRGDLYVLWRGDLSAMRADLTTRDPAQPTPEIYLMHKIDWLVLEGRIGDALAALRASSLDVLDAQSVYLNREGYEALLLWLAGDHVAARKAAEKALARLERELARFPDSSRLLLHTGQLWAILGDIQKGERLIRRTITKGDAAQVDAFDRAYFLRALALTLASAGEHGKAVEVLREALREPGQISVPYIRLHPGLSRYANDNL
ncbi:MAG: tetratricopeptide repeat protein [Verrucomicrobia bacterium]|nr:tetratricopeptide repeat protein [Verrucomicrobiota bacterium]